MVMSVIMLFPLNYLYNSFSSPFNFYDRELTSNITPTKTVTPSPYLTPSCYVWSILGVVFKCIAHILKFTYFFISVLYALLAQNLNLPAMKETWVRTLGWDDLLEKEMATHSNTLA